MGQDVRIHKRLINPPRRWGLIPRIDLRLTRPTKIRQLYNLPSEASPTTHIMSAEKSKGGDMEMEFIETKNATVTERNLDSIEDTKPGPFVWLCATATAIGGSLFGCE